mgnify:CR=1 FL=1
MSKLDNTPNARLIQDPVKRRAWVKYQIQMQGRSMAQVAHAAGVNRQAFYSVFHKPYPRMEKVIAEAIGLTPQALFPERYDADGLPNRRMGRPPRSGIKSVKSDSKDTAKRPGRNVQRAEAD